MQFTLCTNITDWLLPTLLTQIHIHRSWQSHPHTAVARAIEAETAPRVWAHESIRLMVQYHYHYSWGSANLAVVWGFQMLVPLQWIRTYANQVCEAIAEGLPLTITIQAGHPNFVVLAFRDVSMQSNVQCWSEVRKYPTSKFKYQAISIQQPAHLRN